MRSECCGKQLRTPFCPYCGRQTHSPESLLQYLEHELLLTERQCERLKHWIDPEHEFYHPRNLQKHTTALQTWTYKKDRIESWIEWIRNQLTTD